jgi:hypothetical protein
LGRRNAHGDKAKLARLCLKRRGKPG